MGAKLLTIGKDKVYPIDEQGLVIGRSPNCQIYIDDNQASRQHCRVFAKEKGYWLEDNDSHNGTYVNGRRVESQILKSGDKIRVGNTTFVFVMDGDEAGKSVDAEEVNLNDFLKQPILTIQKKNKTLQTVLLQPGHYTLGRGDNNRICIPDEQISTQHVEIFWENPGWWAKDLQSRNGTYVNGKKIDQVALHFGDTILLGETRCIFEASCSRVPSVQKWAYRLASGIVVLALLLSVSMLGKRYFSPVKLSGQPGIAGNLIEDFSFEEGMGWQLLGKMQIAHSMSKSGTSALLFSSSEVSLHVAHEAQYVDAIPLQYGKGYSASLWVKSSKLQGVAGLKLRWLDANSKPILNETYSPLVTGTSLNWEKVEFVICPPPQSEFMKPVCFVVGSAEYVYFDDLVVKEKPQGKGDETLSNAHRTVLEQSNIHAYLDHRGILEIYHGPHLVIGGAKILLRGKNKELMATQAFAIGKNQGDSQQMGWQGMVYCFPEFRPCAKIKIDCSRESDCLQVTAQVTPLENVENYGVEYVFPMPISYLQKKVKLGGTEFSLVYEKMPPSVEIPLNYVVWEIAGDKFGFFYSQPVQSNIRTGDYAFHIYHQLSGTDMASPFTMKIRSHLLQDSELLQEWQDLAKRYEEDRQWGKAAQIYHKVIQKFIFHQAAEAATKRLRELHSICQKEIEETFVLLDRARFLQNVMAYQKVAQQCERLQGKWQEFPLWSQWEEMRTSVEKEKGGLEGVKRADIVSNLFKRAEGYEKEKSLALALSVYQEIVAQELGVQAKEAAANKVKELEKALELTPK
jgi:pSer/pThr/pTyr-binding forkhead associated (FHA) protein